MWRLMTSMTGVLQEAGRIPPGTRSDLYLSRASTTLRLLSGWARSVGIPVFICWERYEPRRRTGMLPEGGAAG